MIIFGISNPDDPLGGQSHLAEGGPQAAALVHSRRQHHDRVAIEDDLKFKAQVANRLQDQDLVGSSGRYDRVTREDWLDSMQLEDANQFP